MPLANLEMQIQVLRLYLDIILAVVETLPLLSPPLLLSPSTNLSLSPHAWELVQSAHFLQELNGCPFGVRFGSLLLSAL